MMTSRAYVPKLTRQRGQNVRTISILQRPTQYSYIASWRRLHVRAMLCTIDAASRDTSCVPRALTFFIVTGVSMVTSAGGRILQHLQPQYEPRISFIPLDGFLSADSYGCAAFLPGAAEVACLRLRVTSLVASSFTGIGSSKYSSIYTLAMPTAAATDSRSDADITADAAVSRTHEGAVVQRFTSHTG
jgi:hypothetical protein